MYGNEWVILRPNSLGSSNKEPPISKNKERDAILQTTIPFEGEKTFCPGLESPTVTAGGHLPSRPCLRRHLVEVSALLAVAMMDLAAWWPQRVPPCVAKTKTDHALSSRIACHM